MHLNRSANGRQLETTMKLATMTSVAVLVAIVSILAAEVRAQHEAKKKSPEESNAGSTPTPQTAARAALASFEKGSGDWKARMEALVRLAKIGPAATPVLIEALKDSKPATREFAALALVLFADSTTMPALERALADPAPGVRLYAIQALSMLGPLPRTKDNELILTTDPSIFGVRPMMAAALERTDRPIVAEMRKALAEYDLRKMDSARLGHTAPDFTLTDYAGKTVRLSQFRGKTVVLRFILFDY
jgi:HEAT repeat protein